MSNRRGRYAESWIGKGSALVLALVWIAGMAATDETAVSLLPVLIGTGIALAGGIIGLLAGYRFVKLPWLAWLSLLAGGYYMACAASSYSTVEGWRDAGYVAAALVFYMAGLYAGQGKGSRGIALLLAIALLANAAAAVLMQNGADILWLGRPTTGLIGQNSRNTSLFIYKNFSALFALLAGGILFWRAVWKGKTSLTALLGGAAGLGGIALSFSFGSRLPLVAVPLLAVAGWVLWFIIRLYQGEKTGWGTLLTGMGILVATLIALYDFLFGHYILSLFSDVDSHTRFLIWKNICRVLPDAPLMGYGAGASQWEIIPFYEEWNAPNYAHNEYLQLWCDYGSVGIGLALAILLAHTLQGIRQLGAEGIGRSRRVHAAMALLALSGLLLAAITDFVWHHFSLIGMGAFACGVLVSPYPHAPLQLFDRRNWAPGSRPGVRPVRAQGAVGRVLLAVAGLGLLAGMAKLSLTLWPGWQLQWQYDTLVAQGGSADARRELLGKAVELYPDPRIMDAYVLLPVRGVPDWPEMERLMRLVLRENPRQLFTVTMLGSVLGRQGRFEEAERLYRQYYPGDGPDNRNLTNWGSYYGLNLLQWGQQALTQGELEKGYSLLNYGTNVCRKQSFYPGTAYRGGPRCWTEGGNARHHTFIRSCTVDLKTLRALGIREDTAWQAPLAPGGKPALYQRYGKGK